MSFTFVLSFICVPCSVYFHIMIRSLCGKDTKCRFQPYIESRLSSKISRTFYINAKLFLEKQSWDCLVGLECEL